MCHTLGYTADLNLEFRLPTILIVDDSRFQHSVLRAILAPTGYTLRFAHNGKEALEQLSDIQSGQDIDGVLIDLIMPEMKGTDLLEILRQQGSTVPVVVLTADIQDHVRRECLALGARAVLHKPAQADLLRQTLADILEGTAP